MDAELELSKIEEPLQKINDQLKSDFDHQEKIIDKLLLSKVTAKILKHDIESLKKEKKEITKKIKKEEPISSAKILRTIYSGSIVFGRQSSVILSENGNNVLIKEVLMKDPDGNQPAWWEMKVGKSR